MSNHTIHSIMYYVIRNSCPPPIQIWPPRWPPQTAAARNASGGSSEITLFKMKAADYCFFQHFVNLLRGPMTSRAWSPVGHCTSGCSLNPPLRRTSYVSGCATNIFQSRCSYMTRSVAMPAFVRMLTTCCCFNSVNCITLYTRHCNVNSL